jgi:D-alanine-D-alanine ligase
MKPLRILVLTHDSRVPPDDVSAATPEERELWKAEHDVLRTLRAAGHEAFTLGVSDELRPIRETIAGRKPDIVFNLLEEFQGEGAFDQHVVAFLELLRVPYTGCNPRGLTLARDKALTKKILTYHRVPVPDFAVFRIGRKPVRPRRLAFPLFVKSLVEEASLGIAQASIVDSDEKLAERVAFIHGTLETDAIAESYIDGREIYVSVLGGDRLQVFPPWELVMDRLPPDTAPIATRKVKWDLEYQKRHHIKWERAKLPEEVLRRLVALSRRVYRALELSGYARLDYRVTEDHKVFLIEANPNPGIAKDDEFPEAAKAAGLSFEQVLQRIVALGLAHRPGSNHKESAAEG